MQNEELKKYPSNDNSMSSKRRTLLRNRLIKLFEQKRLSPMELDISHMYMKEYDGSQKVTKKTLSSGVKRAELLTKLYEDETAASKKRTVDLTKQAQEGTSRKTKRKVMRSATKSRPPILHILQPAGNG